MNEIQQFGESAVVNPEGLKTLEQNQTHFSLPLGWIFIIALVVAVFAYASTALKKGTDAETGAGGAPKSQK